MHQKREGRDAREETERILTVLLSELNVRRSLPPKHVKLARNASKQETHDCRVRDRLPHNTYIYYICICRYTHFSARAHSCAPEAKSEQPPNMHIPTKCPPSCSMLNHYHGRRLACALRSATAMAITVLSGRERPPVPEPSGS